MGIDAGFDLYPPLSKDDEDGQHVWNSFFNAVREEFEDDRDVGMENGYLIFDAGEHPSLPFYGYKFTRFSSKVSMGSGPQAEFYIKKVAGIAKEYFGKRVYYWSEYGDVPNVKYSWTEIHDRRRIFRGAGEVERPTTIPFHTVATAVLTAFEHIHVGMVGLRLVTADFPENEGYRIVQVMHGFRGVNRIEDWTDQVQGYEASRAYWAARVHNNCATLNGALFQVLQHLNGNGVTSVTMRSDLTLKEETIKICSISHRKIGLTPHHVGTIVEPPFTSRVPPSPDGETFHEFLVGMTEGKEIPFALDCSAAQFGLSRHFPYAQAELVPYLRSLGTHRLLDKHEQVSGFGDSLVDGKTTQCTQWALDALSFYWKD